MPVSLFDWALLYCGLPLLGSAVMVSSAIAYRLIVSAQVANITQTSLKVVLGVYVISCLAALNGLFELVIATSERNSVDTTLYVFLGFVALIAAGLGALVCIRMNDGDPRSK